MKMRQALVPFQGTLVCMLLLLLVSGYASTISKSEEAFGQAGTASRRPSGVGNSNAAGEGGQTESSGDAAKVC